MYRASELGADGLMHPKDGNMASAWMQSTKPSVNIDGANRVGTPGAAPHMGFAPPPTPPSEPAATAVATASDIMITEIMVDTDSGRLPQWIEVDEFSNR